MSRPENVGQDYALGSEISLGLSFFKWWKADLSANLYQYKLEGSYGETTFDRESFNWNSRLSNTFRFGKGTRIQINSRYNSPTVTAQGKRGDYWRTDVALSQEFFNKKMTAILQVRDIFGQAAWKEESMGPDFYSYREFQNKSPQINLTLNYRFNNYNRKRNQGENDREDEEF
jgi:hypothetical protein